YDVAGWTPAYTMGFKFDRILNSFDGPFQTLPYGQLQSPTGSMNVVKTGSTQTSAAGYILDSRANNSFVAVNDLLNAGVDVFRMTNAQAKIANIGLGSFFIPSDEKATAVLESAI